MSRGAMPGQAIRQQIGGNANDIAGSLENIGGLDHKQMIKNMVDSQYNIPNVPQAMAGVLSHGNIPSMNNYFKPGTAMISNS